MDETPPFVLSVVLSVDRSAADDDESSTEDAKGIEEVLCCLSGPDFTGRFPVLLSDNVCLHTTSATATTKNTTAAAATNNIGTPGVDPPQQQQPPQQRFALIFCPSTLVESALEQFEDSRRVHQQQEQHQQDDASSSSSFVQWYDDTGQRISKRLLSMLHPFLERNFAIKALIRPCGKDHRHSSPADMVLIDLGHSPLSAIGDLLEAASTGQMIHSGPERVLKVLLLNSVNVLQTKEQPEGPAAGDESQPRQRIMMIPSSSLDVAPGTARFPTCPVCLHRIDPLRLHLPKPQATCSQFCPPPNLPTSRGASMSSSWSIACPRQRLLQPWPLPNHCVVCSDIQIYWKRGGSGGGIGGGATAVNELPKDEYFCCADCGLKKTLWVCLTCAFIGCGRYSNKHSEQHNIHSGHPFCLELSTLRIWSYQDGAFAHRVDLLDCPSSLPLLQPLLPDMDEGGGGGLGTLTSASLDDSLDHYPGDYINGQQQRMAAAGFASVLVHQLKSPKKAAMISEEYEALLYSALEDQVQHYRGEMSRLQARLAEDQLDTTTMTGAEQRELDRLHHEIAALRRKVDVEAKKLLDARSQEARERETSQRLLKEHQVSKDMFQRLQTEIAAEAEQGQMENEDLEQQIADLTANQRMMHEFSTSDDLRNSQIIGGAVPEPPPSSSSTRAKLLRRSAKKNAKKKR
jgi:Zn-finger in ubiquitin-hydrolases and other protein